MRMYVGNLSYGTDNGMLDKAFSEFGKVDEARPQEERRPSGGGGSRW